MGQQPVELKMPSTNATLQATYFVENSASRSRSKDQIKIEDNLTLTACVQSAERMAELSPRSNALRDKILVIDKNMKRKLMMRKTSPGASLHN